MSFLKALCFVVLLSACAVAQVTVIQGTASYWTPGLYAGPFVPVINTPSVTLSTVSPSAVGASNATFGNVAGATNATLSDEFVAPPPVGVYTAPVFYGAPAPEIAPAFYGAPAAAAPAHVEEMHEMHEMHGHHHEHAVNLGISTPSPSVAQLLAGSHGKKANRTYTNQDIDQMNQSTGTVKYDGKTEKL